VQEYTRLVEGPFKDEGQFKAAVLKMWREKYPKFTLFEIENEEKEPGMPDCLTIMPDHVAVFTEFKISDKNGVITFEKTQPPFYKRNAHLRIYILAWDRRYNRAVQIMPREVIEAKSLKIQIPEVL